LVALPVVLAFVLSCDLLVFDIDKGSKKQSRRRDKQGLPQ